MNGCGGGEEAGKLPGKLQEESVSAGRTQGLEVGVRRQ